MRSNGGADEVQQRCSGCACTIQGRIEHACVEYRVCGSSVLTLRCAEGGFYLLQWTNNAHSFLPHQASKGRWHSTLNKGPSLLFVPPPSIALVVHHQKKKTFFLLPVSVLSFSPKPSSLVLSIRSVAIL